MKVTVLVDIRRITAIPRTVGRGWASGRIVGREALTGLLVGAVLAAVLWPVVAVRWGDGRLALAVPTAVHAASTIGTLIAMGLPRVCCDRMGCDPAFGLVHLRQ